VFLEQMKVTCSRLTQEQVMSQTDFSRSGLFQWRKGIKDRKAREEKPICEKTVQNAVKVVMAYPHMGGRKAQAYMIYHRLGFISMAAYDRIKKSVKRLLVQYVVAQKLLPARTEYHHEKALAVHEIWAEDFTDLVVYGSTFKLALLIDVASDYYLGIAVSIRATATLVAKPVEQALEKNNGRGPEKFLLSDNGTPYVSDEHGRLLDKADIVQKRIPACLPQYNGSMECGGKEFKNVFYNVFAALEKLETDKEKSLLNRVESAVEQTAYIINHDIPRPCLQGVSPADVIEGRRHTTIEANQDYVRAEQEKPDPPPWKKGYWERVKEAMDLKERTKLELLTKFSFFCRRPLRTITRLGREGVG
jgi:transposase InsO family protein